MDLFNECFDIVKRENELQLKFYDGEMMRLFTNGQCVYGVTRLKIKFLDSLKIQAYNRMRDFYEHKKRLH